jgi:hypothetical protein
VWLKPVIFFLWAIGLLVIGGLNRRQRREEERWVASLSARTTGEISGGLEEIVVYRRLIRCSFIEPTFRFVHDGSKYERRSRRRYAFGAYRLGDQVPVRYSPKDPGHDAEIDQDLKPISLFGPQGYVIEWATIALGLLLAVAGVVASIQAAFGIS